MQIIAIQRWDQYHSVGAAAGEGQAFGFLVNNSTRTIEQWLEKAEGEWKVVTGPAPVWLQTLVAVKMADEMSKRGEGPAMPTVMIGPAP